MATKSKECAMINFAYFTANFPSDFIEKVWKDDERLIKHFNEKLKQFSGSRMIDIGSFVRFFLDLNGDNQIKLTNWIENEYLASSELAK